MKKILLTLILLMIMSTYVIALESDTDSNGDIDVAFGGTNSSLLSYSKTMFGLLILSNNW